MQLAGPGFAVRCPCLRSARATAKSTVLHRWAYFGAVFVIPSEVSNHDPFGSL